MTKSGDNPINSTLYDISFRSTPDGPDLTKIVGKFHGGGHKFAAGGSISVDSSVKNKELKACKQIISRIEKLGKTPIAKGS